MESLTEIVATIEDVACVECGWEFIPSGMVDVDDIGYLCEDCFEEAADADPMLWVEYGACL